MRKSAIAKVKHMLLVIPAHNEELYLSECLTAVNQSRRALPSQVSFSCIVVADACTDSTVEVAQRHLHPEHDFVAETCEHCVGAARRSGVAVGLSRLQVDADECWISSTDADTIIPKDWLLRQLRYAQKGISAVAGLVELSESSGLSPELRRLFEQCYPGSSGKTILRCMQRIWDFWRAHTMSPAAGLRLSATKTESYGSVWRCRVTCITQIAECENKRPFAGKNAKWIFAFFERPGRTAFPMNKNDILSELEGLPPLGKGNTAGRWNALCSIARRRCLSFARLAEGHADAWAILTEAGFEKSKGLYGVWASKGELVLDRSAGTISGLKPFCSGAGVVDRALLSVRDTEGGDLLVEADMRKASSCRISDRSWNSNALTESSTYTLEFADHPISLVHEQVGWYSSRTGFWQGSAGPAACWAGGALGLLDWIAKNGDGSLGHRKALAAIRAEKYLLESLLWRFGTEIDLHRECHPEAAISAHSMRTLVERSCTRIMDEFSQAVGPRAFVADAAVSQRYSDLHLYLRQHHGLRDLLELCEMDPI